MLANIFVIVLNEYQQIHGSTRLPAADEAAGGQGNQSPISGRSKYCWRYKYSTTDRVDQRNYSYHIRLDRQDQAGLERFSNKQIERTNFDTYKQKIIRDDTPSNVGNDESSPLDGGIRMVDYALFLVCIEHKCFSHSNVYPLFKTVMSLSSFAIFLSRFVSSVIYSLFD